MGEGINCDACSFKASSPEMAAFAKMLVENVREVSRQESRLLAKEIGEIVDEKLSRIDAKLEAIKSKLDTHSIQIAAIEQRMADGERRFAAIEAKQGVIDEKGVQTRIDLTALAATLGKTAMAGGIGGGVSLAIAKMLGG
jgi:DNA repair exonuclease SbcCD ATPase subunit